MANKLESVGIAVIIPLSVYETQWENLYNQLKESENRIQIFLIMNSNEQAAELRQKIGSQSNTKVFVTKGGRAELMNFAADLTDANYLWFLHADSILPINYMDKIQNATTRDKDAISYFDLTFVTKKLSLMHLNSLGAYFRSHILRLPFGDQGFFMSRALFYKLGKYRENLRYGEDHLLIWQAHLQKIPVRCIGTTIATSPRKYTQQGWLKTTWLHLRLTLFQAAPELLKLWKK